MPEETLGEYLAGPNGIRKLDETQEHSDAMRMRDEIAEQDQAIDAANRAIDRYAPAGNVDVRALPKETRDVLEQAYKTRSGALALKNVLNAKLAQLASITQAVPLAKRRALATLSEKTEAAKRLAQDAYAGRLGRITKSDMDGYRRGWIAAEAAEIEAGAA